jgi:hypothetical protein
MAGFERENTKKTYRLLIHGSSLCAFAKMRCVVKVIRAADG